MIHVKHILLLGFPEDEAAELCVQLGRVSPQTPVKTHKQFHAEELDVSPDTLIFLMDSPVAIGQTLNFFQSNPQANLVVLAKHADAEHASELMHAGAMDYRIMPCPDEILSIYIRKAGHQAELSRQADTRRQSNDIFITQNVETRRLLDQIALIAPSRASVLLEGESGSGKERLARYIHQCSDRKNSAFIGINCAAIPEGMLESELFGYEKGAFTGATNTRPGKFELAHEGTLLLDEITEMPLHLQAKLLRVLQEGEVDRLGGKAPISIDVRVIATSNRDIIKAVSDGTFRQDLYYRVNVVTVQLPALRARHDDVEPLASHFLNSFGEMYNKPAPRLSPACLQHLLAYSWPGNVRELENCMHRAFLMCKDAQIQTEHLGLELSTPQTAVEKTSIQAGMSIRDMELALIQQTIKHVKGNRTEAAKLLGISIRTLRNKLQSIKTGTAFA